MGLEVKFPWVEAAVPDDMFPVYSLSGQVVHRTSGANMSCVVRHEATPGWFKGPLLRLESGEIVPVDYASTGDVHQHGTDPWPIPTCRSFSEPTFVLADYGVDSGWLVDRHLRTVCDLTGDRRGDVIGFGNAGVLVALNNGSGGFGPVQLAVGDLGYDQGWRVESHPRTVCDLTGDGRGDVIGFGNDGVWVALNRGDGTFDPAQFVLADFAPNANGWQADRHPRLVADLTGDGRGDLVGFGDDGVWVALNQGSGTFATPQLAVAGFCFNQGWRVDRHPRLVADLTGDGRGDLVGFGDDGVWVALNRGDGTFGPAQFALADLGFNQGWRVEQHARYAVDLTGDGRADVSGFGDQGVLAAHSLGDGSFDSVQTLVPWFGTSTAFQTWTVAETPRFVIDTTGDGRGDVVGFGHDGVWVAVNDPHGPVSPQLVALGFALDDGGWRVDQHPRLVADLTGDGANDLVGFGTAGVWVSYNQGIGPVPAPVLTA